MATTLLFTSSTGRLVALQHRRCPSARTASASSYQDRPCSALLHTAAAAHLQLLLLPPLELAPQVVVLSSPALASAAGARGRCSGRSAARRRGRGSRQVGPCARVLKLDVLLAGRQQGKKREALGELLHLIWCCPRPRASFLCA